MSSRQAFLFYASNLDVIEQFPEDEAKKIAMKIIEYGFSDGDFDRSSKECLFLDQIFNGIDAEKRRYHDVQLVQYYIDTIKDYAHMGPYTSADEVERVLSALRGLQARVRRKVVENLQNRIMDIIGPKLAEALALQRRSLGGRFEEALATASPEHLKELEAHYAAVCAALAYLSKYEAKQANNAQGRDRR